jgi:hypothetical protein
MNSSGYLKALAAVHISEQAATSTKLDRGLLRDGGASRTGKVTDQMRHLQVEVRSPEVKNRAGQLFRLAAHSRHRSLTPMGYFLRRMKAKLGPVVCQKLSWQIKCNRSITCGECGDVKRTLNQLLSVIKT